MSTHMNANSSIRLFVILLITQFKPNKLKRSIKKEKDAISQELASILQVDL